MRSRGTWLGGICLALIALAGCVPQPPPVHFDDSHQIFLEQTMEGLSIPADIMTDLQAGAKVSLVSMETEGTLDAPLIALIEDSLIDELLQSGVRVVERDDEMIGRFIAEGSDSLYAFTLMPRGITIVDAGASGQGGYGGSWAGVHGGFTDIQGVGRDSLLSVPTQMVAADYILAYRVLECGLVYRPSEQRGKKIREAQIRLHVRLHQATTGEILAVRTLVNRCEDLIDAENSKWLSNYHYTFFGSDQPLQQNKRKYREIGAPPKQSSAKQGTNPM